VAERFSDISANLDSQLKKKVMTFVVFSVALDESTDISDVAQQAIFICGVDETLSVTEEFLGLVPMIDTITANDIFNSLVGVRNRMEIYWSRAVGIAFRTRRHCVANPNPQNWMTSCKWLSGQIISSETSPSV